MSRTLQAFHFPLHLHISDDSENRLYDCCIYLSLLQTRQMAAPGPAPSLSGYCVCHQTGCQDGQHHLGSCGKVLAPLLQSKLTNFQSQETQMEFAVRAKPWGALTMCSSNVKLCFGLIHLGKSQLFQLLY